LVPELDGPIYKGIFSDICLLLSAFNFPIMIDPAQHGFSNLSPIAFHARFPVYALNRTHVRDTFLRCVNVSQFGSFL
jgi:hypothetical protein